MVTLGGLSIQSVIESVDPAGRITDSFPDATEEAIKPLLSWLAPSAYDLSLGQMIMPVQMYVIRSSRHTIVVDTCVGNHKRHPTMPEWHMRTDYHLLDSLREAGVQPEEVDYVFCTHMHVDHVGWNTRMEDGRWVPSFPNAKYIFAKTELDFAEMVVKRDNDLTYEDSVLPILEAGQAEIVDTDFALDDEIWLEPTPGHTPGHVAVRLQSNNVRGVISGDLIHSPVQLAYPEWSPTYDEDPVLGHETRRRFLEEQCDQDIVMMTIHFPLPSMGHVIERGRAFGMRYLGCDLVHG